MATVYWSRRALGNLASIHEYWSDVASEQIAERLTSQLLDSVERLRDFPLSGRIVLESEGSDHREVIAGNYRVVYRLVGDETVHIVMVVDGRQDFRAFAGQDTGG